MSISRGWQIVIGLLCDEQGVPVALEAFRGNTADPKTVSSQITKLRQRFDAHNITLVGDRGMLRGPQLSELSAAGLHDITAISKPQIETMLESGTLQMELFDQELGEVITPSTVPVAPAAADTAPPDKEDTPRMERFILRRNPVRQAEIAANRASKQQALAKSSRHSGAARASSWKCDPCTCAKRAAPAAIFWWSCSPI